MGINRFPNCHGGQVEKSGGVKREHGEELGGGGGQAGRLAPEAGAWRGLWRGRGERRRRQRGGGASWCVFKEGHVACE